MALDDPAEAAILYARAANLGHARAAIYLGQMYETGDGVPMNASLARIWYRAAGSSGGGANLAAPQAQGPLLPPVPLAATLVGKGRADLVWTAEGATPPVFVVQTTADPALGAQAVAQATRTALRVVLPSGSRYWRAGAALPGARPAFSDWRPLPEETPG